MRYCVVFFVFLSFNASAALITTDRDFFYSQFSAPANSIDFTLLKDGTGYADLLAAPLSTDLSVGVFSTADGMMVYGNAWSDDFYLRGRMNGGYSDATWWDGSSVVIDDIANRFSLLFLGDAQAVAMDVSGSSFGDFLGIIPDSPADRQYFFGDRDLRIHSISYGFQPVSVDGPDGLALAFLGLFGFLVARYSPLAKL